MSSRKWVLFDIGGVLEVVDDDTWGQHFFRRWQERSGFSAEEYRARILAADLPVIDRRADTRIEYWSKLGRALEMDSNLIESMQADMWDEYCGRLNGELFEYASALRSRADVAILSNSVDGARAEEERRFGFSAVFDPILYSHETGLLKPEPEAYENALERMGADAGDVFFIDDHEVCAEGARAVGMSAIVHSDNPSTIKAIGEFLKQEA
ncbi:HAD-IA family hydrolase [Brevibacterium linens]|uniref:Putative hydrolase of the HAD superfamily n=1 Tax=Brevibacterium linens TaxID=1703 RepID=A0A2H1JIL2_BRELN|nr:HAD-IA family hydrolase [Brevibacterium linens]SMX87263.1 putative hydrolase of the HAD superfamily [Brevibacterium linens]